MTAQTRRMKKLITDSLTELLCARSFDRISKKMICESADIGQTTFYRYYTDKYNIVEELFETIVDEYFVVFEHYSNGLDGQSCFTELYNLFQPKLKYLKKIMAFSDPVFSGCLTLYNKIMDKYVRSENPNKFSFDAIMHLQVIMIMVYNPAAMESPRTLNDFIRSAIISTVSRLFVVDETDFMNFLVSQRAKAITDPTFPPYE